MQIPSQIEYMLCKLCDAGYEAYLVGGCVRDFLLHKTPDDYDITTSALPDEIMSVFEYDRVIPTGLKHGTVTVLHDGVSAEITTYRTETTYNDGRHPDSVKFSKNIADDLCRRDFTVNAMAMGLDGDIIDLYGGKNDLSKKNICAVGEANRRFTEDALRILRAFRFASKLDFEIEENTLNAAISLASRLSLVSRERIFEEFSKLLLGKAAGKILEIMYSGKVFDSIFENSDVNCSAFSYIDTLPCRADVRLAAILLNDSKIKEHVSSLKTSNDFLNAVIKICECKLPEKCDNPSIRRCIFESGEKALLDRALVEQNGEMYNLIAEICNKENCFAISDLAINGREIATATGASGKEIGEMLKKLLFAVFDEKVNNTKEELIYYIKKVDNNEKV